MNRIFRQSTLAAALITGGALFAGAGPAREAASGKASGATILKPTTLEGTVKKKEKGRLTVDSTTLGISDDAVFTLNGASAKWDDIKIGDSVKAKYVPLADKGTIAGNATAIAAMREKVLLSASSGDVVPKTGGGPSPAGRVVFYSGVKCANSTCPKGGACSDTTGGLNCTYPDK